MERSKWRDERDMVEEMRDLREQWVAEVGKKRRQLGVVAEGGAGDSPECVRLAHRLYSCGQRAETRGYLQAAVELYRRAARLVHDIGTSSDARTDWADCPDATGDDHTEDISCEFMSIQSKDDTKCKEEEKDESPILKLPDELLFHIMRWVVGANLDIYSLMLMGLVCQKFLSVSTDEQLWRLICLRLWPSCTISDVNTFGGSWSSMVKTRPHLLFHGCYISSTSYIRKGEHTVNTIIPFLLVRYFRVFRFWSDGRVIMVTSAQDPQDIILFIRSLDQNVTTAKLSSMMANYSVATGKYTTNNDMVYLSLFRSVSDATSVLSTKRPRKLLLDDSTKHHLEMSFQIKRSKRRPNTYMRWRTFSLTLEKRNDYSVTNYDTNSDRFPKIIFSRVREFSSRLSCDHL